MAEESLEELDAKSLQMTEAEREQAYWDAVWNPAVMLWKDKETGEFVPGAELIRRQDERAKAEAENTYAYYCKYGTHDNCRGDDEPEEEWLRRELHIRAVTDDYSREELLTRYLKERGVELGPTC